MGTHGFIHILDRAVPPDVSTHNLSTADAVRPEYFKNRDLEDGKVVRWPPRAAPSDSHSIRVVYTQSYPRSVS